MRNTFAERVRGGLARPTVISAQTLIRTSRNTAYNEGLPEECETVEVKLPRARGPNNFCNPRINGRPPKGCMLSKKTYAFTVEPRATFVKQERIKMQSARRAHEMEAQQAPQHDDISTTENDEDELSPVMQSAIRKREHYYDRARFRQDRAQCFGTQKRFPVLVSQKLMPEWEESEYASSDEEDIAAQSDHSTLAASSIPMSGRRRVRHRLQQPTLILAVRQNSKPAIPDSARKWKAGADVSDVRRLCSRSPVLFQEEYKPPTAVTRETSVDNWVAEDFRLPSIAGAKAAIEYNGQQERTTIEREIAESRAKGLRNRDDLEIRLESRLEAFKREQEERGPLSNFALRELALMRRDKDDDGPQKMEENSTESEVDRFAERMSIGFSRYRMSRLHLPSD